MEVINIIFDRENVNFYVLKSSWLPMKRVLSRIEVSFMSLDQNSVFLGGGEILETESEGDQKSLIFFTDLC